MEKVSYSVMDLVLDVKISDDLPWQKIRPEHAMAIKRAPQINAAGVHEEIDSTMLQSMLEDLPGAATGSNALPMGGVNP